MKDFNKALNYSFLLLKYRQRSKQEIKDRLRRKKYPRPLIDKVICYLEENRYINDEEFVHSYVSSCLSKGWGRRRIWYELKKLGIEESLRQGALNNNEAFKERLRELLQKKITMYKRSNNPYQKIIGYLMRKGFDYRDIINELEASGIKKAILNNSKINRYED